MRGRLSKLWICSLLVMVDLLLCFKHDTDDDDRCWICPLKLYYNTCLRGDTPLFYSPLANWIPHNHAVQA